MCKRQRQNAANAVLIQEAGATTTRLWAGTGYFPHLSGSLNSLDVLRDPQPGASSSTRAHDPSQIVMASNRSLLPDTSWYLTIAIAIPSHILSLSKQVSLISLGLCPLKGLYSGKSRNRLKGLNLIECLKSYGQRFMTLYRRQGSRPLSKASGGDRIPVELFQILKDDAVKVLHSTCQQIWKMQQWPQDWKTSVFIPIPKKGNPKECSNYHTMAFISHC